MVFLKTNRSEYDANSAAKCSMTVGELIEVLENFRQTDKIVFSNDNGYTYGYVDEDCVSMTKK